MITMLEVVGNHSEDTVITNTYGDIYSTFVNEGYLMM